MFDVTCTDKKKLMSIYVRRYLIIVVSFFHESAKKMKSNVFGEVGGNFSRMRLVLQCTDYMITH